MKKIIVILWAIVALLYTYFRFINRLDAVSFIQPMASLFVLIIAVMGLVEKESKYKWFISTGLFMALLIDFYAINMSNQIVMIYSMIVFMIVLILYNIAIIIEYKINKNIIGIGIILLIISVGSIGIMERGAGSFIIPLIIYSLLWGFTVANGIQTNFRKGVNIKKTILLSIGLLLFFFGDLLLGLNTYWTEIGIMWISPLCYTGGQMLIALSCSEYREAL